MKSNRQYVFICFKSGVTLTESLKSSMSKIKALSFLGWVTTGKTYSFVSTSENGTIITLFTGLGEDSKTVSEKELCTVLLILHPERKWAGSCPFPGHSEWEKTKQTRPRSAAPLGREISQSHSDLICQLTVLQVPGPLTVNVLEAWIPSKISSGMVLVTISTDLG